MKKTLTALATTLQITSALAAVPLRFAADAAHPATHQATAYRGESLDIEARLLDGGLPLAVAPGASAAMYWQTNGMGSAWWTAPAAVTTAGVVRAAWSPTNDVGASSYRLFLGVADGGANYRANLLLRMLGSPGAEPNALPLPVRTLDFAAVAVTNAPWMESFDESDPAFSAWADVYTNAAGVVSSAASADFAATAGALAAAGDCRDAAAILGALDAIAPAASNHTDAAAIAATNHADAVAIAASNHTHAVAIAASNHADAVASNLMAVLAIPLQNIASWGSPAASALDTRLGFDAFEGPTIFTGGGESAISLSYWFRFQPRQGVDNSLYAAAFCMPSISMAPARATREGGPELDAFLDLADVPLNEVGEWSTNCVPQDAAALAGDIAVCANVATDVQLTLTVAGAARTLAPSNGVHVFNMRVPLGDPSVSVRAADAGGAVSLSLAVQPWIEFAQLVPGSFPSGIMSEWVHVAGRLSLRQGGSLESVWEARDLSGASVAETNVLATPFTAGTFPANIRVRNVWGSIAGFGSGAAGDPARPVQRFAAEAAPVRWCDEEVLDRFRRGARELRARGLDAPLASEGD